MAGINAALKIQGRLPLILTRDTSYIGTLIDDLVTKGTEEPYRIMTSRSEYRLLHRQDNADQRLTRIGGEIGLIPPERVQAVEEKYAQVRREVQRLEGSGIPASEELNAMLERKGTATVANSARLADLLRRPQVSYADIAPFDPERPELSPVITDEVEIQIKYAGYLTRQEKQVEEFKKRKPVCCRMIWTTPPSPACGWKRGKSSPPYVRCPSGRRGESSALARRTSRCC